MVTKQRLAVKAFGLAVLMAGFWSTASADTIAPDLAKKVTHYTKKLVEWAADPVVVKAVKEANAKGGIIAGMTNAKWDELNDTDPVVKQVQSSALSKKLAQWDNAELAKLFVRDANGNLVGGASKPLIYNASARPPIKGAMSGKTWSANEAKPDPTTQELSVQISAPVLDGGKPIGVIHSAVIQKMK